MRKLHWLNYKCSCGHDREFHRFFGGEGHCCHEEKKLTNEAYTCKGKSYRKHVWLFTQCACDIYNLDPFWYVDYRRDLKKTK